MTHSALSPPHRNTTSLSLVVFERSIEADSGVPKNRSELPVQTLLLNRLTVVAPSNAE